ncbi:membrane protein insertase YidC [Rhodococcus aerolatus]
MLDFIYYPVSAILWVWHKVFGAVLGADNGFAWALSVVFLVFTLRAILYKPFVKQVRTQRQMQELQPQIKALQKKYSGDRQKMATEMQKLQKEHGFNPVAGCLPVLLQAPVFIGLFHVLRSFNRTGGAANIPFLSPTAPMTPELNAVTPNYIFGVDDVQSFLRADLFGAPLSSYITQPMSQLQAFAVDVVGGGIPNKVAIASVAIPLMIVASIATHFTARLSVARQSAAAAANPQSALMNKLVVWVFPLFVLVGGPFLPIAILLYWLSNNGWTLVQQHYVFGKMAKEEEEKKTLAIERKAANAPKPGAKPTNLRKKGTGGGGVTEAGLAVGADPVDVVEEVTGEDTADSAAAPARTPRKRGAGARPSPAFDASLGGGTAGAGRSGGGRSGSSGGGARNGSGRRPAGSGAGAGKQTTAKAKRKRR